MAGDEFEAKNGDGLYLREAVECGSSAGGSRTRLSSRIVNSLFGRRASVMRILLTEDDPALAEALQFALKQAGHAVDWAAHGAAADEALKKSTFGLLILDLGLPKLDGFEVLRRLREHNASLPVLILSGREQPEDKVTGLDLGADDYLVKPFSIEELQARVQIGRAHV